MAKIFDSRQIKRAFLVPLTLLVGLVMALSTVTPAFADDSVSAVVNSQSRNASDGSWHFDITVSGSVSFCGTSCYAGFEVMYVGSTSATNYQGRNISPTSTVSENFTGFAQVSGIAGIHPYIGGSGGFLYGDWVTFTDSVPAMAASISLAAPLTRSSIDNSLSYSFAVSFSNYWIPSNVCDARRCGYGIEAQLAGGGTASLAGISDNIYGHSYPFSTTISATNVPFGHITAVRSSVGGENGTFYSAWLPITSDPFEIPSISLDIKGLTVSESGAVDYDLVATASGFNGPGGICGQYCGIQIGLKHADGFDQLLDSTGDLTHATFPFTHEFHATGAIGGTPGPIVGVHAILFGDPNNAIDSGMKAVYAPPTAQGVGGGSSDAADCGCSRTDPVDTRTGEFYENLTDLREPGIGPKIGVSRSYSTLNAATTSPFGNGWSADFNANLAMFGGCCYSLPNYVLLNEPNGSAVRFNNGGSTMLPEPGVHGTLTRDGSFNWTYVRQDGETLHFDGGGKLTSDSDLHGNTVTYTRNGSGLVTSIIGSGGREIDLTWTGSQVTSAQDQAGRTVNYTYDSFGNLTSVDDVTGATTSYGYDANHRMTTITKPEGGITTNAYDTSGRVISQTDPVGRESTFTYGEFSTITTYPGGSQTQDTYLGSALVSSTSALGTAQQATTSMIYDAAGNKTAVTDPLGHTTTSTFDGDGNALTTTDRLGKVTTRTYNALDETLTVVDPLSRTTTMSYNSAGDMTSLETPGSHTSSWTYNSDGTVDTSTDARGKESTYTYDSAGRPLCVTDPDSRESCQAYDGRGFVTSKTDAAGKVTHLTYDDAGRMLTAEDPNSHTTTTVYDGDGNLTSTEDASGNTATATYDDADQRITSTDGRGKTTTYTYTDRGSVATVTDPNSHVTTNAYDAEGQLTSTTDADSHVTSYGYDLAGQKTSTTMPSTAVSSSTYDDDGRVATTTDALGKVTTYGYDDAGQLTSVEDPLSRVTGYSYTDDGKLHVTTLPDTSTETYAYNAADVQTSFTNANGAVTTYAYNDAGLLSSETQPGSMTTSYTYDSAGRLHTTTTPDGVVATSSYDDGGRLTGVNYPGTTDDVTYTYFADGTRHTMTDGTGTTTYAYNANAALTSVQNGNGATIGYGYDNASQLTSVVYPGSKTVAYGYDNAGNMTSVTDWSSRTTTLTVTPDGLQDTRIDPSGVTETRSYNANDQLTDISSATSSATLSDYGYGYDSAGQLTATTTTDALHTTTATDNWGYSSLGQLSSTGPSTGYTTSSAGQLTATPAGDAFSYNTKQELASATNTGAGTSTAYSYDDNGDRTSMAATLSGTTSTTSYSYDARGNLDSVSTGGITVSYQSDGNGLRQSRTVGATTKQFLWDPNHAIPVLLDDGADSYVYATSTTPIAQINDSSGAIEYLHADNLGSVRTITESTGMVVSTTDYAPYGATDNHSGTSNSSFGYADAWTDPATGTDYLRAREYDPVTAQFLQADPDVDQTHQPYEYVASDPLGAYDPSGLCAQGDSACNVMQYAGFFMAGLGGSVQASVCGNTDGFTCAVQKLDPVYGVVAGIDACSRSSNPAVCADQTFNPLYRAIDAYGREASDAENGCDWTVVAQDGLDAVSGVATTVGLAAGAEGAGGTAVAGAKGVDWASDAGEFNPSEMVGSSGTQLNSVTLTRGLPYRIDVENPAPGVRPGQMHLQEGGNKYMYNFATRQFDGLPNRLASQVASSPAAASAVRQGLRYLGMGE